VIPCEECDGVGWIDGHPCYRCRGTCEEQGPEPEEDDHESNSWRDEACEDF
jgi:hypothetical protein